MTARRTVPCGTERAGEHPVLVAAELEEKNAPGAKQSRRSPDSLLEYPCPARPAVESRKRFMFTNVAWQEDDLVAGYVGNDRRHDIDLATQFGWQRISEVALEGVDTVVPCTMAGSWVDIGRHDPRPWP